MCSYLDQADSTYYFRRAVPQDFIRCLKTETGKSRTEWKWNLRTKDRETTERLLRPHEVETDVLIDNAREAIAPAPVDGAERVESASATNKRERLEQLQLGSGCRAPSVSETVC